MTAPLCLSLFRLCQGQYDAVWRKLSAQRATADTAAELGCGTFAACVLPIHPTADRRDVVIPALPGPCCLWCAGRESCRSLDGSRTAQTDQSGSFL